MKLFNSLTRQLEEFHPIEPGKVKLYVCGVTVYDLCHIGHARVFIVFDILSRYLRDKGLEVTYVRNVTDVDDKIIIRANEKSLPINRFTEELIIAMQDDCRHLHVLPPEREPLATEFIDEMQNMISVLIQKELAYVSQSGDVCYRISKFENYGKLANRDIEELRAGERVEVDSGKDEPLDFVLWKLAKPDEPSWPSPWGAGRPGWHIECSAMSRECLGENIDIHGGGMDLKFPHHENEIAQSEGCSGKTFVNTWMHVGFLQVNDEKMSKSLNNFFTIRDVIKEYDPEVVRYFMASTHYRKPINYSESALVQAKQNITKFYQALRGLDTEFVNNQAEEIELEIEFHRAMESDLNTPEALTVLFKIVHLINESKQDNPEAASRYAVILRRLANILGFLFMDAEVFFTQGSPLKTNEVEEFIKLRQQAKSDKDWQEADRIRDLLLTKGVAIEDTPEGGTNWRVK